MFKATMSHLSLRTPDIAALEGFYVDSMGLAVQERIDGNCVRLGWGRGHHAIELVHGDTGMDHFAFEVHGDNGLQDLRRRLDRAQVPFLEVSPPGNHPKALQVLDPDGNRVLFHGRVDRSGEGAVGIRPDRIQHLVLSSRNSARLRAFYLDVVGFRLSDRLEGDGFCWARSDHYHHSLGIAQRSNVSGLDHFSFDIADWEQFKRWCDHLARRACPVLWGPGRHGPGNNLSIMFRDPHGYLIELSAEMELYWDDITVQQPRTWEASTRSTSLWGVSPDLGRDG
ncbi:MAG: VOC family protein [Paraburkholderia fungorum]|nr:VOC family protein [Paraburkholderia fungorum]